MRARRAILYVPGAERRKIEKAATLGADSVCLDLEDGVAPNAKAEARAIVADMLRTLDFGKSERLARINRVGSGLEEADLDAVLPAHPDGIVIPKVADAAQVQWVSAEIGAFERSNNLPPDSILLIGLIESARGVLNLASIASAAPRLKALIFGAEDYAADVGARRTRDGLEVLYARSAVVTACAAYGLDAIDLLYLDFRDLEGLRAEVQRGIELGYAGMQTIHPNQVAVVQDAYTPDDLEIANAKRITDAAVVHIQAGRGVFALDNKMVDLPILRAAERVLARARLAGKVR